MARDQHVVAAGLLVRSGKILLCHRDPDRRWYPDVWDLPGGHIEAGESPADAVTRELAEELGIEIIGVSERPTLRMTPTDDLTLHLWRIDSWNGEVQNLAPKEHDQIGWFFPHQLDALPLAFPLSRTFIEEVLAD